MKDMNEEWKELKETIIMGHVHNRKYVNFL